MESVLISIKPEWLEKIIRGEKTIEVRKSAPKEVPFRAYIYCTKSKEYEVTVDEVRDDGKERHHNGKGKVVAMFVCDRVDKYTFSHYEAEYRVTHIEQEAMCLNQPELIQYGKGKTLYGLHITALKIYDKPKELSEFWGRKNCLAADTVECWNCFAACREINGRHYQPLSRPPQSWQFVEELEK